MDVFETIKLWRKNELTGFDVQQKWAQHYGCSEEKAASLFEAFWEFRETASGIHEILTDK